MKRLAFGLENRLVDAESKEVVNAEPLPIRPILIDFDARGINGPYSMDEEYLRRLDQAVNREEERGMLPPEADSYVQSIGKASGRLYQGQVWVAIQFYRLNSIL